MPGSREAVAAAGIYDHAGWAVVVCASNGEVIDRRRIELVDPDLPSLPHHHPAQRLPLEDGVALVQRVRASAEFCVARALDDFPASVCAVAIRKRPVLPPTIAERIQSYHAQTRADTVMYREVIVEAAASHGWPVYEYDVKKIISEAGEALGIDDISRHLTETGKALGPPWTKDHRLATAAAFIAALRASERMGKR